MLKKTAILRILLIRVADKETLDRSLTALRSKKIFFLDPRKSDGNTPDTP